VPQGSVLGPLLFLIYINDITANIKSNIKLFADDTSLYVTIDGDAVEATAQLNEDLLQIGRWAENWIVKFNATKTKALTISLKKNLNNIQLPLSFNNNILETVNSHKHLGIEINSTLSWKEHLLTIGENASKKLNVLAQLKYLLDRKTLTTMYTSFIRPAMEYGSIIFCNCTDTEEEFLEKIQRRALRIITGAIIRTRTINLNNEIYLESLKTRRDRSVLLFFFKIINNMVPDYLLELKPENKKQGRYMLRNQTDLVEPWCRLTKYRKSFLPHAVSLWNKLDDKITAIKDYESFKEALTDSNNDNPLFHVGNRQEQIIMAKLRLRCSNLSGHLFNLNIIEYSACSCGFDNEDEFHYFFVCPLYNRPRVTLQNAVSHLAPLSLRTLLFGSDALDLTQNKEIICETLKFIKNSKRFE